MDLLFGHYRLKRKERQVLDRAGPVDLSARSFDILALLLTRPDEVIGKTELFEAVWPGLVVEENTLHVHISALRKSLGAGMIMTVHGRGYKYAGPRPIAVPAEATSSSSADGPSNAHLPQKGDSTQTLETDSGQERRQARGISIVVLPFVNLSSDPEDGFLADGLTEDLTTELSRHKNFLVIASSTAFTYRGRASDVSQIGRELDVRYVLEGSMRNIGARVRITAQLVDVKTGTHLWAEKFDRARAELDEIQDEVVRAVAASTQTQLIIREGENRFRETSQDCWALTMQAASENYKMTSESLARTEEISRRLTLEYPQWARGHALLSSAISHQIIMGFQPASPGRKDEALREARKGVALDPKDEHNLLYLAISIIEFTGDTGEAMVLLRRALDINPNFSLGYGLIGEAYLSLGEPGEAIRSTEIAIRLNPRDPSIFYRYETLARACLQSGDEDKALQWANQIIALKPNYWPGYAVAAAVLASKGDIDHAGRKADALKKCWPNVSTSSIKIMHTYNTDLWQQRYLKNLIALGIPE